MTAAGYGITAREQEVLDRLILGQTTRKIAADLFMTPATCRNHIQSILNRTGTHSRIEAIHVVKRGHRDKGAQVLKYCKNENMQLTDLQQILILQAFQVTESGCHDGAHQWPPRRDGRAWICLCGSVTAGITAAAITELAVQSGRIPPQRQRTGITAMRGEGP